jgi:hypothetical protein
VALVYPGTVTEKKEGKFELIGDVENEVPNICSVITLIIDKSAGQKPISDWQLDISNKISKFTSIS